ncbi:hypothetical protein [Lysobacter sp. cf310]|uniref:hypothetical protein n=1 Tax=Lysobacter sp. cf310 TaxID=1761790 RepID=UPI0008F11277|nr:hypothetical protein [Lysobacter sp. cf310]SFL10779.1 hypothetical protein SAMN04487938_3268 [Lysobacter sp. cf310]
MEDNLYAPPASEVFDTGPAVAARSFYVVSPLKFGLLFFGTLGLYQLYWFYMQWARYRRQTGETVWPVMRAIFSIFFTHALAGHFDAALRDRGLRRDWSPATAATIYVISKLASGVLDRLAGREIGSPYTDMLSLVLLVPLGVSLLSLQRAANHASGDPQGESNRHFTWANYLWLLAGALLWLMVLIGLATYFVEI